MRVGFLTRYDEQWASSRVRAYDLRPYLGRLGLEVRILPWAYPPRSSWPAYVVRAASLARWSDALVLQKPFQPPWLVDLLARINPTLIVDLDDTVWEAMPGESRSGSARLGARFDHAVQRAALVITGSAHLAEIVKARCVDADVRVLPSCVELGRFRKRVHSGDRAVIVGWIGQSASLPDLAICRDVLSVLVSEDLIKFRVVSSRSADIPGLDAEYVPWSVQSEADAVSEFDIGIMPLHDDPRTRGRCGFKAIEYMAAGIPVVASPVPGPSEVIRSSVTGFLASTSEQWHTHLRALASNVELRDRMGSAGRAHVATHYSLGPAASALAAILNDISARAPQ